MSSAESGEGYIDKRGPSSEKKRIADDEKPIVLSNSKGITLRRKGRGYSNKEIEEAFANTGLKNQNILKVRSFHISVDKLRSSTYPENVEKLSGVLKKSFQIGKTTDTGKKQSQTKLKATTPKSNN